MAKAFSNLWNVAPVFLVNEQAISMFLAILLYMFDSIKADGACKAQFVDTVDHIS